MKLIKCGGIYTVCQDSFGDMAVLSLEFENSQLSY